MKRESFDIEKEEERARKYRRIMVIAIVVLLVIGLIVIGLDLGDIQRVISGARWDYFILTAVATIVVFLAQSQSYVLINRAMGVKAPWPYLMTVGLVSIAIGNVVTVLGAAEHTIRAILLVPKGYRAGRVISASVVHAYFKDLVILLLVPIGLIILLVSSSFSTTQFYGLIGLGIGALALLGVITAAIFFKPFRLWLLGVFGGLWRLLGRIIPFFKTHDPGEELHLFDRAVEQGRRAFRKKPIILTWVLLLMLVDWVFTLIALEFSFRAFNTPIPPGTLMVGYALGKVSGIISFIPGGLGIFELSTAESYALLGIPLKIALLTIVLFRLVYHYIPYLVSFVFYRYLFTHTFSGRSSRPS